MSKSVYRIVPADEYRPTGPDGRGQNRLRIDTIAPAPRCALQPLTSAAAYDLARGMYRLAPWSSYQRCIVSGDCDECAINRSRDDHWSPQWHIREDGRGMVHLLDGSHERGWGVFSIWYRSWAALSMRQVLPVLTMRHDQTGRFWEAA